MQRLSGLFKRVIRDFRGDRQIFAWDVTNEPRVYEKGGQTCKICLYAANLAGIKRLIGSSSSYVEIVMLRCNKTLHIILVDHLNNEVSIDLRLRQTGNYMSRLRGSQRRLAH